MAPCDENLEFIPHIGDRQSTPTPGARHDGEQRAVASARFAAATLYELDRYFLGEGLDRLPGNEQVHTQIDKFFLAEAAAICRHCLDRPESQSGYFAYRDLPEILRFAVSGLGRFGDLTDIPTLRALARLDTLGSDVIRAIACLEQRHLSVS